MRLSTPAIRFLNPFMLLLPFVALSAGCGGGAAEAKSGADAPTDAAPAGEEAPLTDADSALFELNRAEDQIHSLLGPAPPPPAEPAASAAPAALPEPGAPDTPTTTTQSEATGSKRPEKSAEPLSDACAIACRALASMGRAASHLCGLSGEGDPTCLNARERVRNATDRVSAQCACSN